MDPSGKTCGGVAGSATLTWRTPVSSANSTMRLDEAAFAAFYQRTRRALWAYVYRSSGNAADADDIVSEAFCRLLQAVDLDLGDEALRAYLFRVAGNLL